MAINETLGLTLLKEVTIDVLPFGTDYITPIIIVVLTMLIISRSISSWKILAFPVTVAWHIAGLTPHHLWYILTVIMFVIESLSLETIGDIADVSKRIIVTTGQAGKKAGKYAKTKATNKFGTSEKAIASQALVKKRKEEKKKYSMWTKEGRQARREAVKEMDKYDKLELEGKAKGYTSFEKGQMRMNRRKERLQEKMMGGLGAYQTRKEKAQHGMISSLGKYQTRKEKAQAGIMSSLGAYQARKEKAQTKTQKEMNEYMKRKDKMQSKRTESTFDLWYARDKALGRYTDEDEEMLRKKKKRFR